MGTLHGQIVNSDFLARHPPQPGQKSIFDMRPAGDGAEEEEAAAAAAVAEEEEVVAPPLMMIISSRAFWTRRTGRRWDIGSGKRTARCTSK